MWVGVWVVGVCVNEKVDGLVRECLSFVCFNCTETTGHTNIKLATIDHPSGISAIMDNVMMMQ